MRKINHIKKPILRFVLANSTALTIGAVLIVIGASYVIAVSHSASQPKPSGPTLQDSEESKVDNLNNSAASAKKKQTESSDSKHHADSTSDKSKKQPQPSAPDESHTTTANPPKASTSPTTSEPVSCPYRSFDAYLNPLVRSNGPSTISYTATYTIAPTCVAFGNPNVTVTITTASHYSPCINMADRNNGIISVTRQYDGNNTFSITCVVSRVPPSNPSIHYVAPLPSASRFELGISATLSNGQIVGGSGETCYLPAGFDRY